MTYNENDKNYGSFLIHDLYKNDKNYGPFLTHDLCENGVVK